MRILSATLFKICGGGQVLDGLVHPGPERRGDGSTANIMRSAKSSGRVISINSPGQILVDLRGARRT